MSSTLLGVDNNGINPWQEIESLREKVQDIMSQENRDHISIYPFIKSAKQLIDKLKAGNSNQIKDPQKVDEIMQSIRILSREKMEYYNTTRFGSIKRVFSSLRNWFALSLLVSSAQLGADLSDKFLKPSLSSPVVNKEALPSIDYQPVIEDLEKLINLAQNESNEAQAPRLNPNARKEIIIHLDINGTLILTDAVTNKKPRDVINEALAKRVVTYWPNCSIPCSFYDYVYNTLIPGKDSNLKAQRDELVTHFEKFVQENQLPFLGTMNKVINLAEQKFSSMQQEEKTIVPSFYYMTEHLKKEGVKFSIQLRTFGKDLEKTRKEIEEHTNLKFSEGIDLTVPNLYEKNEQGLSVFKEGKFPSFNSTVNNPVQDNYDRWREGNFQRGGKVFQVINNATTASIFFDDNADSPQEGKSVRVILEPQDGEGNNLDTEQLKSNGLIVKADVLEALFDRYYFAKREIELLNSQLD